MKSFFRIAAAWCALAASPVLWADNAPEPLKGLVLWQDSAKSNPALSNAISLEFSYFLPCDAAVAQLPGGAVKYDWRKFGRRHNFLWGLLWSGRHRLPIQFWRE